MISRVEHISEKQLEKIRILVGEAFVTKELFQNWGSIDERREDVMKYMVLYVDYVYQAGELYSNEDFTGFIGLEDSENAHKLPQVKMLFRMLTNIWFSKLKSLIRFAKQIGSSNAKYAKNRHLDALMVCVDKGHQGQGIASELVTYAKNMSDTMGIPLLFDKELLTMRFVEELSYKEIAVRIDSNDKAVAKKMERLLKKCSKLREN